MENTCDYCGEDLSQGTDEEIIVSQDGAQFHEECYYAAREEGDPEELDFHEYND